MTTIDTADAVLHQPTGEVLLVAYADDTYLRWCGWPPVSALLEDCSLVRKATPDQRKSLLCQLAGSSDGDLRRYARERLEAEASSKPATASWPYGSMGEYMEPENDQCA